MALTGICIKYINQRKIISHRQLNCMMYQSYLGQLIFPDTTFTLFVFKYSYNSWYNSIIKWWTHILDRNKIRQVNCYRTTIVMYCTRAHDLSTDQCVTFTSLSLVLLWQLFCSSIVINTVIVTAGNFEP
jgi:hypothetical protein